MGENVTEQVKKEARARFWRAYVTLGGNNAEWFDEAVKPLLKIAAASEAIRSNEPTMPDLPVIHRRPVREKILITSLSRLGGDREPVEALV
jgi:hypothetical protein